LRDSYAKRTKRMIATATTSPPRMNGYQFNGCLLYRIQMSNRTMMINRSNPPPMNMV
jgi:hypothetical protein